MAVNARRLCHLLVQNDERNCVHRHANSRELVMSAERDLSVNPANVTALISQGLATWEQSARFPQMLQLVITQEGVQCAKRGSTGYLRRNTLRARQGS